MPEIELRPLTISDLDFVVSAERDPEVAPYILPWSRERHQQALSDPDLDLLLIAEREEPRGLVLLDCSNREHRTIELRRLFVSQPGHGVGRQAIELALRRCFEQHGAHRVWLDLLPENNRARRVYEATGFVLEGTARDALLIDDRFRSIEIMSILEPEWRARRP